MSARRHARQRRPAPEVRGWLTPREFAERTGLARSSVQRWCAMGALRAADGSPVRVEGGDGRDYRIPLSVLSSSS